MYAFGMTAPLVLATLVVAAIAARYLSLAQEFWALSLVAIGMCAAWLADFSLFAAWGMSVRNATFGVTLTGCAIAGVAFFWREVLGLFTGSGGKMGGEVETIETDRHIRRVA